MYNLLTSILLFRRLRNNLSLPKADLEAIQVGKLKALISHAYENVPYYRKLFACAGIEPNAIKGVEDLARIPTTDKLTLQSQAAEEILARGIKRDRCVTDVTSGSTGIPLQVHFTQRDYMIRSLSFIRTFIELGYKLTHRQALVCDTRFVNNRTSWFQRLGILRKQYVPVQFALDKQIQVLMDYRPHFIHGYPQSLAIIADELLKRGIDSVSPAMVCTGAELVGQKTREKINAAFGVEMADSYATIESGMIAWQCKVLKGYHINVDNLVLEFLHNGKPVQPGEPGRVVVTNLHSYAMPIIRYELGDVCTPSDSLCSCGIQLPLMSVVEGRVDDLVKTPSGKMISPNSITNVMEAVDGIGQFRVIQERKDLMVIEIVEGAGFSKNTPLRVQDLLRELVGHDMYIEVQMVSEISKEHTGKIRSVISKVPDSKKSVNARG
jgi:phenylacetate-CoA ligase